MRRPTPLPAGPGQESVWDYPRPPRLEPTERRLVVSVGGRTVADTRSGYRVLETSHPPTYYLPPEDCDFELLRPAEGMSWCEWKGRARYLDVVVGSERRERAVWTYPEPTAGFEPIADQDVGGRLASCRIDLHADWRIRARSGDIANIGGEEKDLILALAFYLHDNRNEGGVIHLDVKLLGGSDEIELAVVITPQHG